MKKDAHLITVNAIRQIDSTEFTSDDVWELVKDQISGAALGTHLLMLRKSGEIAHVGYRHEGKKHLKLYAKTPSLEWAKPEQEAA